MNDFTKEELQDIREGICNLISVGSADSQWNKDIHNLKDKIQSMIDNYCEHKPNTLGISCAPNDKVLYTVHKCSKCERFYFDDNQQSGELKVIE